MGRRILTGLLALLLALSLSACAGLYDKEVYSVTPYEPTVQEKPVEAERVTVRNLSTLRKALLDMVYAGQTEGLIAFDEGYDGEGREDMSSASWQVRRQDALSVYCVQDITYEYSTIVNHDEAVVHIRYADSAEPVDSVLHLTYATGLESILREALEENRSRVVLLIDHSSYSADEMERLVASVYHADPRCSVSDPKADVYLCSGSGMQRLYEITLDYGLPEQEILRRKEELAQLEFQELLAEGEQDEAHTALSICRYLQEHCTVTEAAGKNTVYDALVTGEANSEGLALAYVQICHSLGLDCQVVYGQRTWQDHCWNIVFLDGAYYHVDVSICIEQGFEAGFLLSDTAIWTDYRWDTTAYEPCDGTLSYAELTGAGDHPQKAADEPLETEEPELIADPFPEEPAETEEPEPTASEQPEPAASEDPEPAASEEPEPAASESPEPAGSEPPEISETETPAPEESEEPVPLESEAPVPVETETPESAALP